MAVYSIQTDGGKEWVVQVTGRFKIFDTVTLILKDGTTINGEIVYIEENKVYITGPYRPIEKVLISKIVNITPWRPPDDWK